VADRLNAAIAIGAQAQPLDRVGAVGRDVKDLLARQRDFHRPLEFPRGDRRQDSIGIDPVFAAETAADERADQAYVLDGNFQGCRDDLLTLIEHLVGGMQDQFVAVPHRQSGMRFHHRMALQWGGIGHIELHRGAGERAREIAYRTVGGLTIAGPRNACRTEVGAERIFSDRPIILMSMR